MSESTWQFDLFEPGMTMFHRAGLVGLLASLETHCMGEAVREKVSGNVLTVEGLGESAEDIHHLLQTIYRLDDGLIQFPVFGRLLHRTLADIQNVLLQTFLQHPQSRQTEAEFRMKGGEGENQARYKPLTDFNHRSKGTAELIAESRKTGKFIRVAGWALPGAVAKHIAHNQTSWEDTPERFLLLMCAPLGSLYFNAQSYDAAGDWDKRTQSIIVIPQVSDLQDQADRLSEYYAERSQVTKIGLVAGVTDAVLQTAIEMKLPALAYEQGVQFYALRFGGVVWSKQQKTRTSAVTIRHIDQEARKRYFSVLQEFGNVARVSAKGATYGLVMPMREQIAKNLLQGDPWYLGFHEYMHGKRRWLMMTKEWREGMSALVENRDNWNSELKKGFIDVMQKAVNNRLGKVYHQAVNGGSDTKRAFSREYEKMILSFQHCRTKEALRETLMRFVANTYPRLKSDNPDQLTEREILHRSVFEGEVDWKELRDLCLLAIATYRGSHAVELDDVLSDTEDKDDIQLTAEETVQ